MAVVTVTGVNIKNILNYTDDCKVLYISNTIHFMVYQNTFITEPDAFNPVGGAIVLTLSESQCLSTIVLTLMSLFANQNLFNEYINENLMMVSSHLLTDKEIISYDNNTNNGIPELVSMACK